VSQYSKAIAALVVTVVIAAVTAWQAAVGDGWQSQDWATIALAAIAPIAVYLAPRNEYPDEVPADGSAGHEEE
jgi:hypothetical protein